MLSRPHAWRSRDSDFDLAGQGTKQLDAPCFARHASNQAAPLELDDHAADTWWRGAEVALHRRAEEEEEDVRLDGGEVLLRLVGEETCSVPIRRRAAR